MKPRVFVVQEPLKKEGGLVVPRINYNTLTPYGEVVFLFQWGELKDEDALSNTGPLVEKLRLMLEDFSCQDYIVPLGNPALIAMAVLIAADCNEGRVQMLDWMRNEGKYRVVDIDIDAVVS